MATARFAVMVALAVYLRHRTSSTGDEAPSMARSRRTEWLVTMMIIIVTNV